MSTSNRGTGVAHPTVVPGEDEERDERTDPESTRPAVGLDHPTVVPDDPRENC